MQEDNLYKKVLILREGAIGDIIHTLNVPRAIKEAYPDVEIHYYTCLDPNMLKADKNIDKIWYMPYDKTRDKKELEKFAKILKEEHYDVVLKLQLSPKIDSFVRKLSAKKVVNIKKIKRHHIVMNYWETAKRVFPKIKQYTNLKMYLPEDVSEKMKQEVSQYKKPVIIFNAGHIFAKRQGRTYPVEQWLELGKKIQEKHNGTIILTGIGEDAQMLKPLDAIPDCVSYISKLSLLENSALIKNADMLISGDSGPLHIAAALGVKSIGLFGAMPVSRFRPCGNHVSVITSPMACAPCDHIKCKYLRWSKELYSPCMKQIEVADILQEVDNLLSI